MKNLNDTGTKSWFGSEDTTCSVYCECECWLDDPDASPLFVSSTDIIRCPHCGRGYKTEFIVWQYEPGEKDV